MIIAERTPMSLSEKCKLCSAPSTTVGSTSNVAMPITLSATIAPKEISACLDRMVQEHATHARAGIGRARVALAREGRPVE